LDVSNDLVEVHAEVAALSARLVEVGSQVLAGEDPRGGDPQSPSGDGFGSRARDELGGSMSDDDQTVFQSFPLSWSLSMIHVFLALVACRISQSGATVDDLSEWTGLASTEVEDSIWELLNVGMLEKDGYAYFVK
jgi:hypothetical protein